MKGLLLAAGFAVILVGAVPLYERRRVARDRLELGSGAAGGVFAAVATALPESTIPIVAIIGGAEGSEDAAIGAIVGAPFILATIAMALVGRAAIGFAKRREQGRELRVHTPTLRELNTAPLKRSFARGVRERRGRLAADDGRGLVHELVVLEGLDHEQGCLRFQRS